MTVAEFFHSAEKTRLIPIVGELSGGSVSMRDAPAPSGTVGHVALNLGENNQIALTVSGNALAPTYRHGDTIIATKLTKSKISKALNRDCVVVTTAGEALIKTVRKGSRKGAYSLRDLRPSEDDIDDVELQWAAPIIWIGRAQ